MLKIIAALGVSLVLVLAARGMDQSSAAALPASSPSRGSDNPGQPERNSSLVVGSGYHERGGMTLDELVNSPLVHSIAFVEVIEIQDARIVQDKSDSGAVAQAAFTPVLVRVESSVRGELLAGNLYTLRALGGEVGGMKYVFDSAPRPEALHLGDRWLVVGGNLTRSSSDTQPAFTPAQIYIHNGEAWVQEIYADELPAPRAYSDQDLSRILGGI